MITSIMAMFISVILLITNDKIPARTPFPVGGGGAPDERRRSRAGEANVHRHHLRREQGDASLAREERLHALTPDSRNRFGLPSESA